MKGSTKTYYDLTHEAMIRSVIAGCLDAENYATTASVPAFLGYINGLQSNMDIVSALRVSIPRTITGYAAQKMALKKVVSALSANIMGAVYSYAIDINSMTIASQVKISTTQLERMSFERFLVCVQQAINIITPIVGSLGAYNVTGEGVTTWQNLLTQLRGLAAGPKNAIAFRKAVNIQIQNLMRVCVLTLYNNCDRVALSFRNNNSRYYSNYRANRKLYPYHLSTQLRFTATTQSGQAVAGEVFVVGTDRSAVLDSDGYALVNYIPHGTHSVLLTTAEGEYRYGEYEFVMGKSRTLKVEIGANAKGEGVLFDGKVVERV